MRPLCGPCGVRGSTIDACSRLVAIFILGIAWRVCGEAADREGFAPDFLWAARFPEYAEIVRLAQAHTVASRPADQEAAASSCSL